MSTIQPKPSLNPRHKLIECFSNVWIVRSVCLLVAG